MDLDQWVVCNDEAHPHPSDSGKSQVTQTFPLYYNECHVADEACHQF